MSNNKPGKDCEYPMGESLRKVDRQLQDHGVYRDSSFMNACHAAEHYARGLYQDCKGNHEKANEEYERARSNASRIFKSDDDVPFDANDD